MTTANVVERLSICSDLNASSDPDIKFLAARFVETPDSIINQISVENLGWILCVPSLKLQSEDWLYEFISDHFTADPDYLTLLEFVHFEYLSVWVVTRFCEESLHYFDRFNLSLWTRVCARLVLPVTAAPRNREVDVPFRVGHPFDGIVASLAKRHSGNLHDLGIVSSTASSFYGSTSRLPLNMIDLESNSVFSLKISRTSSCATTSVKGK
jgi:hypothetical protein